MSTMSPYLTLGGLARSNTRTVADVVRAVRAAIEGGPDSAFLRRPL